MSDTQDLYSFGTPCLKWKIIAGTKDQFGWPGFQPPHFTRYLSKQVTITDTLQFFVQSTGPGTPQISVRSQKFTLDQQTGNIIFPTNLGTVQANADFPYGFTLPDSASVSGDTSYTDNQVETSAPTGLDPTYFVHTIKIKIDLSDRYTDDALDADAQAVIDGINPDSVPWNTLQAAIAPNNVFFDDPLSEFLPDQVNYGILNGGPVSIPIFKAAAWYVLERSGVGIGGYNANLYTKAIGYVAMAGKYCKKTYYIDQSKNVVEQFCESGKGLCGETFKVLPPQVRADNNAYILILPNCQCDGS